MLERFYDLGISGLTKENIQNSLDGKLPDGDQPVIVAIKTGKIHQSKIPGLNEIKDRIECLEGRNSYTRKTITHMKQTIKKLDDDEFVDCISFEDSNTKGLKGQRMDKVSPKKILGEYMHITKVFILKRMT